MADTKISALPDLAAEPATDDKIVVVDTSAATTKRVDWSVLKALFVTHALATAANDFLVASGVGVFVKKTLAETLTILGKAAASGLASLDGSSLVVQNPANATTTPTASKIPISDANKHLDPAWLTETVEIVLLDNNTALSVADGIGGFNFVVPERWNGWDILSIHAAVPGTYSSSGTPTIQVANVTDSVDILSTRITIDANEYTSYTAAVAPVVDGTHDDLATGDRLRVDCDVAGTGTKGLVVIITAGKP